MKRSVLITAIFASLLHAIALNAQTTRHIKGIIYADAAKKEPLAGATITIKGSNKAVTTLADGSFDLDVPENTSSITVSYTGFESRHLDVRKENNFSLHLEKQQRQLEDVIVTGYGSQNKKFIAGSIATVNASDFKDIPAASFNQLLQGKAAGVQVTANSGVPGGGITFRVRGNNSINASVDPLYIVDGVFISNTDPIQTGLGNQQASNPLADINPSDIQSIQILKDANATAIYGSLGANGVVIITTKRGRLNSKAKINLNVSHGWSNAVKKFDYISGKETGILANEAVRNTAIDNGLDPNTVVLPFPNTDSLQTYDRIDGLFRTAHTSNYELAVTGGTEKSTYYIGAGYLKQQSIVLPSDFERYNVRVNYDSYLSKALKVGTSVNLSRTWRNVSSNDNNPTGVINSAIFPRSYVPIYKADGTFNRAGSFDNHIALIQNLNNDAVGWRTIGNVFGELTLLPGLKLRSSVSIDLNYMNENNYANTLISAGIATKGSANAYANKNTVFTNEQVLSYLKTFGNGGRHQINALVGNTFNSVVQENTTASGQGFATNSLTAISVAATKSGSSSRVESNLVSFFGKASYTLDNKYTLDASLRGDASSKFGANRRWGYFPSGGITWRAGQEAFIQNLNIFDELKFRLSAGWSGNQNGIGAYAAQGLWASGANYLENPGTAPSQLANPDLSWETTRQVDLGVEFTVLKNRLTASVDYYDKYTYDLLLNVPVPSRSGYTSFLQNFGAVRNRGVEVSLHSTNIDTRDFRWTTDFNISFNRNKIEKLAADIALGASGRNISILRQGYAVNSFQLYKQLYVDPNTGNAVYEDVNKDNVITSADRQIVGNANPNFTGGLTNNLSYKNIELNFFFYFSQGNQIMNMHDFFLVHGGTQNFIGFIPRQLERWQQPGDQTDIPRLTTYRGNPTVNGGASNNYGGNVASLSSRYLEDGSFLRLRNVSLSYNIPSRIANTLHLSNVKAYLQVTNLFTITKYGGLDPEVSSQSGNQNTAGYDWATVPQPRTIQVGLNLSF